MIAKCIFLNRGCVTFILVLAALGFAPRAPADRWALPPQEGDVIGEAFTVHARGEDTLLAIARRYGLGYREITIANPGVDVWLPGDGTVVQIPRRFVLPDAPREGIVLNIPEMRLYYYPEAAPGEVREVVTHPVSVGRMDWQTPLGLTHIVSKVRNPAWYPPETIRAEHAARGDYLPQRVPPGPENPLGGFAMKLGIPGYLIHGTNDARGIGMRVTHGCIRMYPEDIVRLFDRVPEGTPVRLVSQPVKAGWMNGKLWLEVHPPLEENNRQRANLLEIAYRELHEAVGARSVSLQTGAIRDAVEAQAGTPVVVGTATEAPATLQVRDERASTETG